MKAAPATLDSPISALPGVGPSLRDKLKRLGVEAIRDMLYFFPRRHIDYSAIKPVAEIEVGQEQTIRAIVWEASYKALGRGLRGTQAILGDETGNVKAVWYNNPYLAQKLAVNARVLISGKVSLFRGQKVFQSPDYEMEAIQDSAHTGRLIPVYPLTQGLYPRTIRRLVKEAVDLWSPRLEDFLPQEVRERCGLPGLAWALAQAHYPDSQAQQDQARRRLAFDELFLIQLGVLARRRDWQEGQTAPALRGGEEVLRAFLLALPFSLTTAQGRALEEVLADLGQPRPMIRLLQGEVGSGKTVVAAAALVYCAACGHQGALMVPTEILAEQHFRSLAHLLAQAGTMAREGENLAIFTLPGSLHLRVAMLTGGLGKAAKEETRGRIARGEVALAIGTHALIQEEVEFQALGLAVVDEQHRFGVMQRSALRRKGDSPHLLAMTATPIPRTLALTLYGDLDLSLLDQLPPGRQPVRTKGLQPQDRDKAYRFIRKEIETGRQAFIVCPLIEESESIQAQAATVEYEYLSREVFPQLRLGLLHGRMPAAEKEEAMLRFSRGELDILVATPVVEVGIDVANASVILVQGAERFGLAQLHQLRGRVGRGAHPGYCILLAQSASPEARERLEVVERIHDGFALAEEDLRLRGPGEFFGTRQSGLPDLRMARLSDVPLLELARREARSVFQEDPHLQAPERRPLGREVARLWSQHAGEVS